MKVWFLCYIETVKAALIVVQNLGGGGGGTETDKCDEEKRKWT
jgi:hypothetical protein